MNNNPIAMEIEREHVEAGMRNLTDANLIRTGDLCHVVLSKLTPDHPKYPKYKLHSSIIRKEVHRRTEINKALKG